MKVVLYTHNFPPRLGGMATLHRQYAEALAGAGRQVSVHVFGAAAEQAAASCRSPYSFPVRYHRRLSQFLFRPERADLYWFSFGEPLALKCWLCNLVSLLRRPYVVFAGGRILLHSHSGARARARQAVVMRILRQARGILADGEDIRRELAAAGVDEKRIAVVYSGVDVGRFSPQATPERFAARLAEGGLSLPPPPRLLFLGRVAEENGPRQFLSVLRGLSQCSGIVLGDGPLLPDIREEATSLGDRVLVAGRIEHELLPSALSAGDLCVFPLGSLHGGIPLSVMEAMAAGRACVAYEVGDLARLIMDGRNGRLVAAGDLPALMGAARALLSDGALRARLARRAAETVSADWTLARAQARFVAHVERWAAPGPECEF
ncbi:glycosyltransferase family 4 protein [bacterium]|nr:glycosyltransferase family 4 protein [bacterium]